MTTIEIEFSEDDMKKLNTVANHQGNDTEKVAWLAVRLYLSRFNDLDKVDKENLLMS